MEENTLPAAADYKKHLGDNIRRLRMMLGMKQGTLAELTGCTQSTISNIENREDVDEETLAKIAHALRVPVELIENFETEEIVKKIQNFYDEAQQNNILEGAPNGSSTTTITNTFDVIRLALESSEKLSDRIIKDKEAIIRELKVEIRNLKADIKELRAKK